VDPRETSEDMDRLDVILVAVERRERSHRGRRRTDVTERVIASGCWLRHGRIGRWRDPVPMAMTSRAVRACASRSRGWRRDLARARDVPLVTRVFTADATSIVDDHVDVVLELSGGPEPARQLVERALAAAKPVVTGNKELIAAAGAALRPPRTRGRPRLRGRRRRGRDPADRPLRESPAGDRVTRILVW
jgi:hypothetical protein